MEEDTDQASAAPVHINRVLKSRGDNGSAADTHTIGYFLNMAGTFIVDIELKSRLTALAEEIRVGTPRKAGRYCLRFERFHNGAKGPKPPSCQPIA